MKMERLIQVKRNKLILKSHKCEKKSLKKRKKIEYSMWEIKNVIFLKENGRDIEEMEII